MNTLKDILQDFDAQGSATDLKTWLGDKHHYFLETDGDMLRLYSTEGFAVGIDRIEMRLSRHFNNFDATICSMDVFPAEGFAITDIEPDAAPACLGITHAMAADGKEMLHITVG